MREQFWGKPISHWVRRIVPLTLSYAYASFCSLLLVEVHVHMRGQLLSKTWSHIMRHLSVNIRCFIRHGSDMHSFFFRLFDSQNNNRGGYNVGSLYYYNGSVLPVEWWVTPHCYRSSISRPTFLPFRPASCCLSQCLSQSCCLSHSLPLSHSHQLSHSCCQIFHQFNSHDLFYSVLLYLFTELL